MVTSNLQNRFLKWPLNKCHKDLRVFCNFTSMETGDIFSCNCLANTSEWAASTWIVASRLHHWHPTIQPSNRLAIEVQIYWTVWLMRPKERKNSYQGESRARSSKNIDMHHFDPFYVHSKWRIQNVEVTVQFHDSTSFFLRILRLKISEFKLWTEDLKLSATNLPLDDLGNSLAWRCAKLKKPGTFPGNISDTPPHHPQS